MFDDPVIGPRVYGRRTSPVGVLSVGAASFAQHTGHMATDTRATTFVTVLTPLYFLVDLTGRQYAPPTAYPQFFYGFLSVAMAWQIAFLVIGTSPVRFRFIAAFARTPTPLRSRSASNVWHT